MHALVHHNESSKQDVYYSSSRSIMFFLVDFLLAFCLLFAGELSNFGICGAAYVIGLVCSMNLKIVGLENIVRRILHSLIISDTERKFHATSMVSILCI